MHYFNTENQCIFVRTLSGQMLHTYIPAHSKISAIKKVIMARLGINCEVQQLYFGRTLLLDHHTVSMLPNEAHIDLKLQLFGGPNYFCDSGGNHQAKRTKRHRLDLLIKHSIIMGKGKFHPSESRLSIIT